MKSISRDTLRRYGKIAGIGVVGAGLGAGAFSYADNGPTQDEHQNIQDKVDDLESDNSDLQEELENRPTQEVVDDLEATLKERNEKIDSLFTQEEVNDMVADATEREDLIEYLPVIADEDAEISNLDYRVDKTSDETELSSRNFVDASDFDDDEFEGEDFDEVQGVYTHDDGHTYRVTAVEFEDSEDAEVYEDGVRDAVEDEEYDESLTKDAEVVRSGTTVVYIEGSAVESDYDSYDFEAVAGQY